MESLLIVIIGTLGAAILPLVAACYKLRADLTNTRTESNGWKISYEREKERADIMAQDQRDAKLAVSISNTISEALAKQLGGERR